MKAARIAIVVAALLVYASHEAHAAEADETNESAPKRPLFVRAYGGAARGSLFAMSAGGPVGGLGLGGGVRWSWGGIDGVGDVSYDALSTEHGVGIHRIALGVTGELVLWRFRLGAGFDTGTTWIERLSGSKASAYTLFLGLHATAGFDLFTISRVTAFVAARGELNTAVPTLGGQGGFRYAF